MEHQFDTIFISMSPQRISMDFWKANRTDKLIETWVVAFDEDAI